MPSRSSSPLSWRVRRLGDPEHALSLEHAAPRPPGPGEARVAVDAVGLNFPDLLLCSGGYQERPALPFSPGFEAAGTVVDAGDGSRWRAGNRVIVVPELPDGAMQQVLTVPDHQLYAIPDTMPARAAAVLHIAFTTAHMAIHHRGQLRHGETLLVHGGAGGVGSAAIQVGHAAGAYVVATATGAGKAEACRRFGADVALDLAAEPDAVERIRAATGGSGADVVVDPVGGTAFDLSRRCVAFEGRVVVVGFAGGEIASVPTNHLLLRNYSVVGLHLAPYRRTDPELLRTVHDELVALHGAGVIAPAIHRELPFERAAEGLALLAGREAIGRVVLRC